MIASANGFKKQDTYRYESTLHSAHCTVYCAKEDCEYSKLLCRYSIYIAAGRDTVSYVNHIGDREERGEGYSRWQSEIGNPNIYIFLSNCLLQIIFHFKHV